MIKVIIESPYNAPTPDEIQRNIDYARCAMQDCLLRDEAPYASHLLYTQVPYNGHVSDDNDELACIGRQNAIDAGLEWGKCADKTVVYQDLGISKGMKYGIKNAEDVGRPVEYRNLSQWNTEK